MNTINSISNRVISAKTGSRETAPKTNDFMDRLKASLTEVDQSQHESDQAIEEVVQGRLGVHEGMLRIQEADLSMRMFLQVRSKVLEAYREIMRLQF